MAGFVDSKGNGLKFILGEFYQGRYTELPQRSEAPPEAFANGSTEPEKRRLCNWRVKVKGDDGGLTDRRIDKIGSEGV